MIDFSEMKKECKPLDLIQIKNKRECFFLFFLLPFFPRKAIK